MPRGAPEAWLMNRGREALGMADRWLGWTSEGSRADIRRALASLRPKATLAFASSAEDLRERVMDSAETPWGVIVGLSESGVSDMNLAAAVAHDGMAGSVVLVTRNASGSLRSRAAQAGIDTVIDMGEVDAAVAVARKKGSAGGVRTDDAAASAAEGTKSPCDSDGVPFALDEPDGLSWSEMGMASAGSAEGGRGSMLVFVSGRGGVGKTTIASECAVVASSWGMSVAVVDLDLSCGNVYAGFGVGTPVDLAKLGANGVPSIETMGRSCVRLANDSCLWGPCERPEMAEQVMPHVGRLLEYLVQRYQLVLVDTSTTFTDAVAEAVQKADRVFVIHDGAPGSIGSAGRTSSLVVRLGVARTRMVRVENVANPRVKPNLVPGISQRGLEGAPFFQVIDGGPEVQEVAAAGGIRELVREGGPMVQSVKVMLARTLAELGALPPDEDARLATNVEAKRPKFKFFSRRAEVV